MNGSPSSDKKTHSVSLDQRRELQIHGVEEVISFDDNCVMLTTTCGDLTVEGSGLQVSSLDVDRGFVFVSGTVNGFYYSDNTPKKRRKLFGGYTDGDK